MSKLPLANSRSIVNLYVSHLTEICGLCYLLAERLKLHWSFSFQFMMIYQTEKLKKKSKVHKSFSADN